LVGHPLSDPAKLERQVELVAWRRESWVLFRYPVVLLHQPSEHSFQLLPYSWSCVRGVDFSRTSVSFGIDSNRDFVGWQWFRGFRQFGGFFFIVSHVSASC